MLYRRLAVLCLLLLLLLSGCGAQSAELQIQDSSVAALKAESFPLPEETAVEKTTAAVTTAVEKTTAVVTTAIEKTTAAAETEVEKTKTAEPQTKTSVTVPQYSEVGADLVWVPVKGGTKYHKSSICSNMKEPIQVNKSTAINYGYTPCKKCYK